MKTVLIFTWFYLPFVGGAELFVKAITDRLAGRFRFVIVTARASRNLPCLEESEHVQIVRTGLGLGIDKFLYPVFAVRRALGLPTVDLVHAVMVNASAVAAFTYSRLRRRRTLLTLQEGDSEEYVRNYLGPLFSIYPRLHRPFDRIHSISHYLESQAIGYGADPSTIRVIPNGVDVERFVPGPPDETLRKRLDLVGRRVVVSVSRLVPKNGLDIVVRALPRVLDRHRDVVFVMVGDGAERSALERLVEKLDIRNAIRFAGAVDHETTVEYLRLAELFVRPSRSEGLGSAFLEAMACGIPVVAAPVGGITDFLRDGQNGLFVEADSSASVGDALLRLLSDAPLAARLAKEGRDMVRSHYRWDTVARDIGEVYDELLRT